MHRSRRTGLRKPSATSRRRRAQPCKPAAARKQPCMTMMDAIERRKNVGRRMGACGPSHYFCGRWQDECGRWQSRLPTAAIRLRTVAIFLRATARRRRTAAIFLRATTRRRRTVAIFLRAMTRRMRTLAIPLADRRNPIADRGYGNCQRPPGKCEPRQGPLPSSAFRLPSLPSRFAIGRKRLAVDGIPPCRPPQYFCHRAQILAGPSAGRGAGAAPARKASRLERPVVAPSARASGHAAHRCHGGGATTGPGHAPACRPRRRAQLSWCDALIVEAAIRSACAVMYSEALSRGRQQGGLRVSNPFLAPTVAETS